MLLLVKIIWFAFVATVVCECFGRVNTSGVLSLLMFIAACCFTYKYMSEERKIQKNKN